ncbi:DUF4185 domain-containing protein [Sunxiuqinia sp. A32]|uniref:DUF4185 domain-containing protein n=1 Tax=Sunxiuqinia sp. A32 TaxID=3461496 RepID=UPI00404549B0
MEDRRKVVELYKRFIQNRIFTLLTSCFLLLAYSGCSKTETKVQDISLGIELSDDIITADASTGMALAGVTITGFDQLDYLEVTKVDGFSVSTEIINQSQLTVYYDFEYEVNSFDSNSITIEFLAVGKDKTLSETKVLTILKPLGNVSLSRDVSNDHFDKQTGIISTTLAISPVDQLDFLFIKKIDRGIISSQKIQETDVTSEYEFEYTIDEDDSYFFTFEFVAVDKSGWCSDPQTLIIDRRESLVINNIDCISRITGAELNDGGLPEVNFEVNNETDQKYNVGGTDLGIIWEMNPGKYGLFFGDTFGSDFRPNPGTPGPNGGSWRSNVLLFSEDTNLDDGLVINGATTDSNGNAREVVAGGKDVSGTGDWTSIPTAAVRANGVDYVHYMNIRAWAGWITNYSSLYKSVNNGDSWSRCWDVLFGTNSNFGQAGYFKKDGYVYMVGTVTGRDNKPHLARFIEKDIERQSEYEFWDGNNKKWEKGNENAATALFEDAAGELSIAYHEKYDKWILLYFNGPRYEISYRTADNITGPWSNPAQLASGFEFPQLYGSYIHPRSLEGDTLYFTMSMWLPYNVYLMAAELTMD